MFPKHPKTSIFECTVTTLKAKERNRQRKKNFVYALDYFAEVGVTSEGWVRKKMIEKKAREREK